MFATVCHKRERSRFEDNNNDTCMMDDHDTTTDENNNGTDFNKRSRSNAWGESTSPNITTTVTTTTSTTSNHHLYPFSSSSSHTTYTSQSLPPLHHSTSSDQEPLAAMQYIITQQQHTRKFSFDTSSPSPTSPNHLMTSPSNGHPITPSHTTSLCTSTPSPTHAPPCSPNLISDRMTLSPSPSSSSRMCAPPSSPLNGKMTPQRSIPRRHLASTDMIPNDTLYAQHETGWAMVNRKLHLSPVHHTTTISTPTSTSTSSDDPHVRRHVQSTMRRMLLSTNPPVSNMTRM